MNISKILKCQNNNTVNNQQSKYLAFHLWLLSASSTLHLLPLVCAPRMCLDFQQFSISSRSCSARWRGSSSNSVLAGASTRKERFCRVISFSVLDWACFLFFTQNLSEVASSSQNWILTCFISSSRKSSSVIFKSTKISLLKTCKQCLTIDCVQNREYNKQALKQVVSTTPNWMVVHNDNVLKDLHCWN